MKHRLEENTWTDVRTALSEGYDTIVFAAGATEQHGPHLPLVTDALIGDALALATAEKLGHAFAAPTVRVGCSEHHMKFPGTLSIDRRTLIDQVCSYARTLSRHGFQRFVIIPSHGGNFDAVREAVGLLRAELPQLQFAAFADLQPLIEGIVKVSAAHGISPAVSGIHAGEFETSVVLHLRPDLVVMERAEEGFVGDITQAIPQLLKEGVHSVSSNGILGDARPAQAERGRAYLEAWVDMIVADANAVLAPLEVSAAKV
jgi:creatinine amidohydrolase/Fe(II)-dependent formamide hydrolase-like protein